MKFIFFTITSMTVRQIISVDDTAELMFQKKFRKDCLCARKDKTTRYCFGHLFAIFNELTFRINVSLSLT